MAYDKREIERLKSKANMESGYKRRYTFYKNIDSNEEYIDGDADAGFMLRTVISLCLVIAFVLCRLSTSEKAEQTFSAITSEISVNQSADDIKAIFNLNK